MTTEEFIKKAKEKHGDEYDYSLVKYTGCDNHVDIICKEHGVFSQKACRHLQGRGCPHKECKSKHRIQTNLKKYGVEHAMQCDYFKDKLKNTCLMRYGVTNAATLDEVKSKFKNTCLRKYGVVTNLLEPSIRKNTLKHFNEVYGGNSPMCSDDVRTKQRQSMLEKYGVEYALQSSDLLYRAKNTLMSNYSVDNPMLSKIISDKVAFTKSVNNTFHTSIPEDKMYAVLCDLFSKNDVFRHHSDVVYPFACDFYIKSRNLWIELNASWTHGGYWYNINSYFDVMRCFYWMSKHTDYYDNAVNVWSNRDVLKRFKAKENNLNYVVFWNNDLSDFYKWIGLNCPDGKDWNKEYSWLLDF